MTQGRGKATPDGILSTVGKALVLAALLSLATQFGLLFRLEHANVSLVWLTSGVATAGLLLLGLAFAPVVWLATWGAGLAGGLSGTFAATLALGTTVGAVLSVVLLRRCVPSGYLLDNLRNLLALVTLGALVNGLALALPVMLVGNTGRPWDDLAGAGSWLLWCLSTANGTLLSVPLVLSLTRRHTSQVLQAKWPELLVLLALSAAAAGFVFGSPGVSGGQTQPVAATGGFSVDCMGGGKVRLSRCCQRGDPGQRGGDDFHRVRCPWYARRLDRRRAVPDGFSAGDAVGRPVIVCNPGRKTAGRSHTERLAATDANRSQQFADPFLCS